ncbi:hypothetical protein IMCC3317_24750 [Kordia antarctica]|uniref:HTH araC/xylS-type domain-containing protein n=1 Tax=Kordia antarctica TaxID=1218801 RepID=A0A7L4ZKV4_9FLAO|nr:helix-turn-helix domain-containing protein [Kordia antarctica]QHI37097.1 hypothetical protein IMCC3317_24750 [Kordia antarctica]
MNKFKTSIKVFFFAFFSISVYSQQLEIDTLKNKSFKELRNIFYKSFNNNKNEVASSIARYTLESAKTKKDSVNIINAYIRLSRVNENIEILGIKYIDSSIYVSKRSLNEELLAESYYFKGKLYENLNKYNLALNYYFKSSSTYNKINDFDSYYMIQDMIGQLKLRVKDTISALKIMKKGADYQRENMLKKGDNTEYIISLHSLSIAYSSNNLIDSSSQINKEGYNLAKNNEYINELIFTHLEGGNEYAKKNYNASKDSLIKSLVYLTKEDVYNLSYAYFYLGKIYSLNDNKEQAVYYFKKVDSIFEDVNFIMTKPRDAYDELIDYYKNKNDLESQLYYTNRLLKVDSILDKEYKGLITKFHENHSSRLLEENAKDKSKYLTRTYLAIFLAVALLLIILKTVYNKKNNEKRYLEIIEFLKTEKNYLQSKDDIKNNKSIKNKSNDLDISESIIENILAQLEVFEKSERYLKPISNIRDFSKEIDTNYRYLSKVINHYKSKNFQKYVNDLRVNYVIKRLQKDEKIRKYKIRAIAEEVGFTNTESFTKAFKELTGLNVSFYVKKLNNVSS